MFAFGFSFAPPLRLFHLNETGQSIGGAKMRENTQYTHTQNLACPTRLIQQLTTQPFGPPILFLISYVFHIFSYLVSPPALCWTWFETRETFFTRYMHRQIYQEKKKRTNGPVNAHLRSATYTIKHV